MLQIKNISKQYKTGDLVQIALNKVSLNFRDNEFVSILGPSGSGKTTLLNIIGGLDRYDNGDLIINNVSTKKYKDRDWDSYRNHTVGFVFQSYNLIPHQTVLANVELALTISGINKKARRRRALAALDKVGLKEQAHKKPNQMSGGQMQRVAIARALVNDPDILLADEPTGALDTHTSVQVMELLKEVAKDRLVIMVTHNPELAEKYSTRIVNLRDGEIQGDTNPFEVNESKLEKPKHKNLGKSSMSMLTAFALSLNNLLTKKGRTFLTSFAGSIGIIGIAMILSLSTGFQNYVDKIQEDTLTSYPLSVSAETGDMTSLLLGVKGKESEEKLEKGKVKEEQNVAELFGSVGRNDLKSFKKYIEENQKEVDTMVSLTRYDYAVAPTIYTRNANKELVLLNPSDFISSLMGSSSSLLTGGITIFSELVEDEDMANEQYEVIEGKFPKEYNEIMLVLPEEDKISDMLLYGIGLRDLDELEDMVEKIMDGEKIKNENKPLEFTYEELMNLEMKLVDPTATYKYNSKYDIYEDMTEDDDFMDDVYDNALDLKIVGIAKPKGETTSMTGSGVLYTRNLTKYIIETASKSEIVQKQLSDKDVNVFSGKDFDDEDKSSGLDFQDMISIDEDALSSAFGVNINESDIENMTKGYMTEISNAITADTAGAQKTFLDNLSTITKNILNDYISENQFGGVAFIKLSDVQTVVDKGLAKDNNKSILASMEAKYVIPQDTFSQMYNGIITAFLQQYVSMMGTSGGMTGTTTPSVGNITVPSVDTNTITGNIIVDNTIADNTVTNSVVGNITTDNTITNTTVGNTVISDGSSTLAPSVGSSTTGSDVTAPLASSGVDTMVSAFVNQDAIISNTEQIAVAMTEATMQKTILTKVGELTGKLMGSLSDAFNVDTDKFADAFQFDLSEDEIRRLIKTMTSTSVENADTNLLTLGYQDLEDPSYIYFYFNDFDSKEKFIDFLDEYNEKMEKEDEEKVIKYSDLTGVLMSSVKTIVDSVSYVLIAFVSISLIVSSIMIGIITYISVLERTKEIGVLRAIGASKKNISSIFNAETFIVGLFSGLIGIGTTLLLLIPTNLIIHSVNSDITAVLPVVGGAILVALSVILTLIGGLIPSKAAAKKDPVLALRSE